MKAADQRENLIDSRDFLGASQRIDDAGMPTRTDHHQPAIAQPEACGMFVPMLIGLRLTGEFVGREVMVRIRAGIATQTLPDPKRHPGVGQHMLEAGARHRARGEGVVLDDDRRLRKHGNDVESFQLATIQGRTELLETPVGVAKETMAEIVFTSGKQPQVGAHPGAVRLQKPNQAADMIVMAMADDQRIDLTDIYLQQIEVVRVDIGCKAEVEQVVLDLLAPSRLEMQGEAPLALQRPALRRSGRPGPPDCQTGKLRAALKNVVRIVSDLLDGDLIDYRGVDPQGNGACRSIERNAATHHRAEDGRISQEAAAI